MTTDQVLVIGNPTNRRVTLFAQAVIDQGLPAPRIISHLDAIQRPALLLELADTPLHVRIDSTGEDAQVEGLLLDRGHPAAQAHGQCEVVPIGTRPAFGRLCAPRQHHLGLLAYLDDLDHVFTRRPAWRIWSPPSTVRAVFDKRVTSATLQAAGVPVPEPILDVTTPEQLRAVMCARGLTRVVVKLSCGSSAAGLAVVGLRTVMTTMRWEGDGWCNSLKVQRVDAPQAIDRILRWLLAEGAQIERFVPKARFDGSFFDLRVLCVAGEPAFIVMRQAHHPITNLHLGGWRGDLDALRAEVPDTAWTAAMDSCRTAAALYPSHHLGIDLLFEPRFGGHRIIELNAFGDLLPRLCRDGLDVYGWEIARRPD